MSQFTKAVEQKQVAEQDAERAKFVVMLAEQARANMDVTHKFCAMWLVCCIGLFIFTTPKPVYFGPSGA